MRNVLIAVCAALVLSAVASHIIHSNIARLTAALTHAESK